MPTNVSIHYLKAEQEYHEAKTTSQKIKALKKMLALCPKHKGTEKLVKEIKERIKRLKYKHEAERRERAGKGKQVAIKKEGAAQIVFIGLPNSGKSTLLSKLSGKPVGVAEYPFTTKEPEIRMIPFENIWLQGVEIPAIYPGFAESKQGRQFLGIVRNADFVVLVLRDKSEKRVIGKELAEAGIILGSEKKREGFNQVMPYLEIKQSEFEDKELPKKLWLAQHKIRVQTKTRERVAEKPIILKEGATVKDVAQKIHKDFLKKFRFAKIWGPSAKFPGQAVGLEHELKDGDIIKLF